MCKNSTLEDTGTVEHDGGRVQGWHLPALGEAEEECRDCAHSLALVRQRERARDGSHPPASARQRESAVMAPAGINEAEEESRNSSSQF